MNKKEILELYDKYFEGFQNNHSKLKLMKGNQINCRAKQKVEFQTYIDDTERKTNNKKIKKKYLIKFITNHKTLKMKKPFKLKPQRLVTKTLEPANLLLGVRERNYFPLMKEKSK